MTSNERVQIDLRMILRLLSRWFWLLLLGGVIGAGLAYWLSLQIDPIYQAKSLIVIEQNRAISTINAPELLTSDRTSTYLEFINQGLMDDKVAALLGIALPELQSGINNVGINQVGRTELFEITVRGYFPDYVAAVANALPDALNQSIVDVRMDRFEESKANLSAQLSTLKVQIDATEATVDRIGTPRTSQEESELQSQEEILAQYRSSYANLVQSYENIRLIELQSLDNIAVARPATTPNAPVSSNLITNTILGFIIGLSIALTFVTLVEYLDDSVKDPLALQSAVDTTLLGMIGLIPKHKGNFEGIDKRLITLHEPRHPLSEHYRIIRTNMRFASVDKDISQLIISSAASNEGKSTTVANLGISLAQSGQRVLIIDADMRKPSQHHLFNLRRDSGLVELLVQRDQDLWMHIQDTVQPNLHLLSSGQSVPNPTDLLESKRFKRLMIDLQDEFNIILLDTPPILPVSDAAVLASFIPNVVTVANAKTTRETALKRATDSLSKVGVKPIGVILNQYRGNRSGYYGYDEYYSDA